MRLYILTRTLNVGINHIISFLEKHPELGEVTNLTSNSLLNDKQVAAVVDFFKDELNNSIKSTKKIPNNNLKKSEEHKIDQEHEEFKIHTEELKPEIHVVDSTELEALNQSIHPKNTKEKKPRPKKKTKEERQKEREEREKKRQQQHQQMKEEIITEIHSIVYESDKRAGNHNTTTIWVNPTNTLNFRRGFARLKFKKEVFLLKDSHFYKELNKIKNDPKIFKNSIVEIKINKDTKSFFFTDKTLCETLKHLGQELHTQNIEERKKKETIPQNVNKSIIVHTNLMRFQFYDGIAYFFYKNEQFSCNDNKFIKDYNKLYKIAIKNINCNEALRKEIKLILNLTDKTFVCNSDFNIHNYLKLCLLKFSIKIPEAKYSKNNDNQDCLDDEQKTYCKIENIEFFNLYYKIWIVKNGQKVKTIQPLIITDPNSQECLQIVSKYFEKRIPNDVMIVFTNKKVERLVNGFKLIKYVETLKKNKDIPSDWWNSSDNREIKTLENYRKISYSNVNKEVSYKNIYIDYLTGFQGENPLLIAYEIFNGQEEKCFVFNISIDDKKSAIIYENININRATNVFIIDKQDYEESMNLIFNYFTDEDLSRKRMSIRTNQNPPEKFKAIEIRTINHDNLNLWINKLNELIKPSSKQNADGKNPKHIQFVPGLNLRSGNTERVNTKETIVVKNLHDEIKEKLYLQLFKEYGADNVGTEISIGKKKIDLVVKHQDSYDLYEVKTNQDVRICIREAIGQIIDYAFFECNDRIGKMFIIGQNQISKEAVEYLENIRLKHNLPIYYQSID